MKLNTLIIIFIVINFPSFSQIDNSIKYPHQGIMLGIDFHEFREDFGFGMSTLSPTFWHEKVRIKAGYSLLWLQYIQTANNATIWKPYQNARLGVQSRTAIVAEKIYIYGEGGVVFIFPSAAFSTKSFVQGGYGCFGFEFNIIPKFCYYLELGGIGTGAIAEKALYKPIYSNGFMINVGMRFAL